MGEGRESEKLRIHMVTHHYCNNKCLCVGGGGGRGIYVWRVGRVGN